MPITDKSSILAISTERLADMRPELHKNLDARLSPDSIAEVCISTSTRRTLMLKLLQSYLYLVNQDRSAWTWELDREWVSFDMSGYSSSCSPARSREMVIIYYYVIDRRVPHPLGEEMYNSRFQCSLSPPYHKRTTRILSETYSGHDNKALATCETLVFYRLGTHILRR